MNTRGSNRFYSGFIARAFGIACLVMLLGAGVVHAQNTKGDRPTPANRDNRFKKPFRKNVARTSPKSGKRVKSADYSRAGRASSGGGTRSASGKERPGRPIRPITAHKPQTRQKAWTGDITGRRIRTKSPASEGRRNVYPSYGRYGSKSPSPGPTERGQSNGSTLARARSLQSDPRPQGGRKQKVVPRSSSRAFIARKSINVYANFKKPTQKRGRSITSDLAGKPLKKRNFESPRPGVSEPVFSPYHHRGKMGDKPYKGSMPHGYRSATRTGRAWTGDISGRAIRGRNFTSKNRIEGTPTSPSGNNRSASRGHTGVKPILPRPPGIGAIGINRYRGDVRGRRPLKGGGSVSGRIWNNEQTPIEPRRPSVGGIARFQGNIKGGKPLKGGGSVSGRIWNNDQTPIQPRTPTQSTAIPRYQGNIKGGRPLKGGGSVSGRLWNNNQTPIQSRTPTDSPLIPRYQGNIKASKPLKGGGSVSGKLWNNEERPIEPRRPKQGEEVGYFQGNVKAGRKPYAQSPHSSELATKKWKPKKSAYEVEGLSTKVKRPDYKHNDNTSEDALDKKAPSKSDGLAGNLQIRVNQPPTGRKPNAVDGSLPGYRPSSSTVKASEYARGVRRNWDYVRNPSSSEDALKVREPGKAFAKVSAYQGNVKMHKYELFERNRALHPDSKFVKTNKNNVDSERDALTNFKLWWSRLFKKEETQPEGLKYKGKKPRYDKGEAGLWYE